jgi:hypothetical protein
MAQHERKLISQRAKDVLAPLKGTGKLGNPCLLRGERIPGGGAPGKANAARTSKADNFALEIAGSFKSWVVDRCGKLLMV